MSDVRDYSQCSLNELYQVQQFTDPDKYPERAAALEREIQKRLTQPAEVPASKEFGFGGFWRRLAASFVDLAVFLPLALLFAWFPPISWQAMAIFTVISSSIVMVYDLVFHYFWGQTVGKMVLGVRVQMVNGQPLTVRALMLRFAPEVFLSALFLVASIQAYSSMPYDLYVQSDFVTKAQLLQNWLPGWWLPFEQSSSWWYIIGAITLVANRRKRAVHDFIAGTVVTGVEALKFGQPYRAV